MGGAPVPENVLQFRRRRVGEHRCSRVWHELLDQGGERLQSLAGVQHRSDEWFGRLVQLAPLPAGELVAEARLVDASEDRFSADLVLRDADGRLLVLAEGIVAELRAMERADEHLAEEEAA